jgi:hypothetical protein
MLTKLSFFLLVFFSLKANAACDFKPHVTKVFSLSGPMTIALKHMGLLKHPKLYGISVFNPIAKDEFKGRRFPGGVFISQSTFSEFSGGIVFYDESRELSRILDPMSSLQARQIKTRGLTPGDVTSYLVKEIEPFVEHCEKELSDLVELTKKEEAKLLARFPKPLFVLYFLGEYHQGRPPEMLMVNDGIVKWLVENGQIKTYPSPLAYVNWSAKIMKTLPDSLIRIVVKDSAEGMTKLKKKEGDHINFTYPGALVPGISQLEAWNYLMDDKAK